MSNATVIKFASDAAKEKYKKLLNDLQHVVYASSMISYIMGKYAVIKDHKDLDDEEVLEKIRYIFNKSFPSSIRENWDQYDNPGDISDLFIEDIMGIGTMLASFIVDMRDSKEVDVVTFEGRLAELVFSEDDTNLSDKDMQDFLDYLDSVPVGEATQA